MSKVYRVGQYEVTTIFSQDNVLCMIAEHLPTEECFRSNVIELMRIKKDTINATLERKSQKNLKCTIEQIIEDGVKYLLVKFTAAFDFIPEFSQEIKLPLCEKSKNAENKIMSFQAQILNLSEALDRFQKTPMIIHKQITLINSIKDSQSQFSEQIKKGQYLFKFSGQCVISTNENAIFELILPGKADPIRVQCATLNQGRFTYPISFTEFIEAQIDGTFEVKIKNQMHGNVVQNNFQLMKRAPKKVEDTKFQNCHFILQAV